MHDPIKVLVDNDISSHSYGRAVFTVQEKYIDGNDNRRLIALLLNSKEDIPADDLLATYTCRYLVQNLVKQNNTPNDAVDVDVAYTRAKEDAATLVKRITEGDMRYMLASSDDPDEEVKPSKRGQYKESTLRIYRENKETLSRNEMIQKFIDELGMSEGSASAYYYNCVKRYGKPIVEREKKISNREKAVELYKEHYQTMMKDDIVQLFIDDLGLSHGGAQAYYYNASNEVGKQSKELAPQKPKGKKTGGPTKKDEAVALYKANYKSMMKDDIISLIMEKMEASKNAAQTYYYTASNEVGKQSKDLAPAKKRGRKA